VVPNRTNHISFEVDQAGTYTGQCAEFCGLEHGRMKLRVVALDPPDWESWVTDHRQPADVSMDPMAAQGRELFLNPLPNGRGSCTACHSIGDQGGIAAPNLTHFADPTHQCFAGCDWDVKDTEALKAWLRDPNAVKLGAKMPDYQLNEEEIDSLVAYLYSLT